ncbi:MAG: hypothetical protein ACM3ZU_14020 [Bacteroidota bacterium]
MNRALPHLLRIAGLGLILIGLVAAFYGPLEIYVFYLLSPGGRFHYEGFGMGSLWFAALVAQNIGYYAIAALFIPLGIGHLKLRRWVLTLTRLCAWFWLGAGVLVIGNAVALMPSALRLALGQRISLARLAIAGAVALVLLVALPVLMLRLYGSERVKLVLEKHDTNSYWTDRYAFPLLALLLLFAIMIIVMHLTIFFQGLFPAFGQILLGRQSARVVSLCILLLGILIYGPVQLKTWAWWGSLVYVSLLTVSTVWSFSKYGLYDILLMLNPPAYETEFLDKLTLMHDLHPVGVLAPPLFVALALIVCSRRCFREAGPW